MTFGQSPVIEKPRYLKDLLAHLILYLCCVLDMKKEVEAKKYQIGNFTKTVLSSGKVSLSTKKETAAAGGLRSRPSVPASGDRGGGGRDSPQVN